MAPALTEPISPTEKLSTTAATASASPATRSSSRKLEAIKNKSSTNSVREKRNCNGNLVKTQIPTPPPPSSLRSSRSKEAQKRDSAISLQSSSSELTKKNTEIASVPTCTAPNIIVEKDTESNEQMGLSTAPADTKNIKNYEEVTSKVEPTTKEQDTSTAQLLADLTNEALTAEICLRNQLKDVDLAKVGEGNSSPLQRSNDIIVDNALLPSSLAAVETTQKDIAHMDALCHKLKSNTLPIEKNNYKKEAVNSDTVASSSFEQQLQNEQIDKKNEEEIKTSKVKDATTFGKICSQGEPSVLSTLQLDPEQSSKALQSGSGIDNDLETLSNQESPIGSPEFSDSDGTKKHDSKPRILEVQELPPVSTDSTMTASEVEDNLEERLSQLDGTAIDSPPPNQEIDRDVTLKETDNLDHCTTTPPRTPTHHQQQQQQTLSQDLQLIQQQLQNTPPTPIAQQVQGHTLQQHQNSFTPQSTTSVNSLGSGNIPQSFIKENEGGGTELEDQDIEEVFKVLKGFEGGTTSDLNVCDLNVLFNEVYMKMNESEIGTNTNNVPVSGGIVQSPATNTVNPSIQPVKPTELEEGQLDIEKRQQQMQRKVDFLMRRLRKQQSRHMCKHSSEEIGGLFEWSSRQSAKGVQHIMNPSSSEVGQDPSKYFLKVIAARPPATDWKDVQEATVPATQLSAFLRKIESVANAQQLRITPTPNFNNLTTPRRSKKYLNENQSSPASSSYLAGKSKITLTEKGRAEDVIVSAFDENVTDELTQVAGLLQSEMCEVQRAIDSDATESSSGGESADEMVTYNNQQQQTLPITKRAAWRYSRDRAAIASRWSWLLSQISDLEIKIRQHSELHQEIVLSKGAVVCPSENGLKIDITKQNETDKDVGGSCRTRGFVTTQFRKRKLIQTTNIHTISKKAARPSSIKCGCQWPLHPCALCTGRSDPTAPRDLPDTMMMSERIALLDSGYHPVLSFKDNVNNALHFEAIAKQSEWQQKVMRCQAKSIAKSVWKAERDALSSGGHHSSSSKRNNDTSTTKRRYVKKKDRISNEEKSFTSTSAALPIRTDAAATAANSKGPASSDIDAGNGTANTLSTTTSTTPLVANSKLLGNGKKCETTIIFPGRQVKSEEFGNTSDSENRQQQYDIDVDNNTNDRLSPDKLRSIQSQPNTFIIDLQQQQQQQK